MNFKNIGIDNLQASKAFKQIRASSRTYTTNLTNNTSPLSNKYYLMNKLFLTDINLANTNNFGLKRAVTLTSAAATTSLNSTFLDKKSMDKFLMYNLQFNNASASTNLFNYSSDL